MSSYFGATPQPTVKTPQTVMPAGPRLEPAGPVLHGDSQRFYHPLQPGQKPTGYEPAPAWAVRSSISTAPRPYWLATRGPSGDAALEAAKQFANANTTPAMAVLNSTLHPLTDLGAQLRGARPVSLGGVVSDIGNIATNFVPVGKAAGILGGLRGLKALKDAKTGAIALDTTKAAKVATKAGPVPAYVNKHYADQGIGSFVDKAHEPGYVYHRTTVANLPGIKRGGLVPAKPVGNPEGVYFGNHPLDARGLSQKSSKGSVYVRVKKEDVPNLDTTSRPFGESFSPTAIAPHHIEYLGADGGWHPVSADAQATLRGALKGARVVRGQQEAGYSAERTQRVATANAHLTNQALPAAERLALAKEELRGELPKIDFQGMKVLDDHALSVLQTHILDHPHLMPFQKINAATALTNAVAGKVPTKSELTLLEHVFGKDTANSLGQIHTHPLKDTILSILNVPRSLMASFDLSAPFRQGLVVSTRHPSIFFKNFKPMVKAFGSEKVYQAIHADIRSRPTYPMMMEGKLSLTDLGRDLGSREEQFASNIAEKIPVAGHGVRASGRAYVGFLDKTRADVFDHLIKQAEQQGLNVQNLEFLRSLGKYINSATGRGDLGHFQEAGKVLNTFLFSPRLLASRLNFLNPLYYARLDPFARKEALRSALQLAGTLSTLVALASRIPGVQTVTDPRNPDWGKIRLGNTRIDIAGGFQQPLRLLAQLATGTSISSTTGKKLNLGATGFGQSNRLDVALRFFEGKESPIASLVTDYMRNSTQIGTPFSWDSAVAGRMIPLLAQDSYDLYKEKHGGMNGLAAAFAGYGVGSIGLGMQTYGPKQPTSPASQPASYFSPSSPGVGGSYFAPSSSVGGSSYFASQGK